jgi:hypothetical protein
MITKAAIAAPHDTPDSSRKLCQILKSDQLTARRGGQYSAADDNGLLIRLFG